MNGEKIYNEASGETIIIQKYNNRTKRYTYEKDGSYTYEEFDNKDNLLFMQCKNITPDGVYDKIIKEKQINNKTIGFQTLYKNGKLEYTNKYIVPSKNSVKGYPYEDIGYNAVSNTYYIEKCDKNNNTSIQYFDNNLRTIDKDSCEKKML